MQPQKLYSRLSSPVKEIEKKIFGVLDNVGEEGNLFPFTIYIRCAILMFLGARLWYFWNQYGDIERNSWIGAIALFALYVVGLGVPQEGPTSVRSVFNHAVQIVMDSLFFIVFYLLTGNPDSGLLLMLFLPLLIVARYFPARYTLLLYIVYLVVLVVFQSWYLQMDVIRTVEDGVQDVVAYAIIFAAVAAPLTRSEKFKRDLKSRQRVSHDLIDLIAREAPKIAESQDPEGLVRSMVVAVRESFNVETVALFIKNEQGIYQRLNMAGVQDGWLGQERYAPGEGLTGRAVFGKGFLTNHADREGDVKYLPEYQKVLPSRQVKHLLSIPLSGSRVDGIRETFGILRIVNKLDEDGHITAEGFSALDWDSLTMFGAHLATAMTAAWREQEFQSQVNRLRGLSTMAEDFVQLNDSEALFQTVVAPAARLIGAEDCSIYWVDRAFQTIDLRASNTMPHNLYRNRMIGVSAKSKAGLPAFVAATGSSLVFVGDDYMEHRAWNGANLEQLEHLPSKTLNSMLLHPISELNGSILGVIEFKNKTRSDYRDTPRNGFTPRDRELVAYLAAQIAAAFRKIHLHGVTKQIGAIRELRRVLPLVAKGATEVVPADFVVIIPYDAGRHELLIDQLATFPRRAHIEHGRIPQLGGATEQILTSPEGYITVKDLVAEPEKRSRFTNANEIRAYIGVALKERDVPVGIMYCNFLQARPQGFAREEINYARTFGDLAAIAIQNATLHERAAEAQRRSEKYIDLARQAFLNSRIDNIDSVLSVAVDTICELIGFDFCTISLIDESQQQIVGRRGKNAPWAEKTRHHLSSNDIQADICRRRDAEIIKGWDERFDRLIYERYGHEKMVRIFAPIQTNGVSIGTVEAGYDIAHKTDIPLQDQQQLLLYLDQLAYMIQGAKFIEQRVQLGRMSDRFDLVDPYVQMMITKGDLPRILEYAADMLAGISDRRAAVGIRIYQESSNEIAYCAYSDPAHLELRTEMERLAKPESDSHNQPLIEHSVTPSNKNISMLRLPFLIDQPERAVVIIAHNQFEAFPPAEVEVLQFCVNVIATWYKQVLKQIQFQVAHEAFDVLQFETLEIMHTLGFGTHIRNARTYLAMLSKTENGSLNSRQARYVRTARKQLALLDERVRNIINLRDLNQELGLEKRLFEVGLFLSQILEQFTRNYEDDIVEKSLSLRRAWDTCDGNCIMIDFRRLSHALENLLVNALKFTPHGGEITLGAEIHNDHIYITVSDTGIGINPDYHTKIFEQSVQVPTTNRSEGAGLGLYVAKGFVRLHGGVMRLSSSEGKGSIFTLMLPTGQGEY